MALTKVAVKNNQEIYIIRQTKNVYINQIADEVGISQEIEAEFKDEPVYEVAEIIRTGKAIRYQAVLQVGNTTKRRDLLVAQEKIEGVRHRLLGKKLGNDEIIDLIIKRYSIVK